MILFFKKSAKILKLRKNLRPPHCRLFDANGHELVGALRVQTKPYSEIAQPISHRTNHHIYNRFRGNFPESKRKRVLASTTGDCPLPKNTGVSEFYEAHN